jgi:hypothetical protein
MKDMFWFILLCVFGLPLVSMAKGESPRYYEHISIKKISHNHSNVFDTIEITAYLIRKEKFANLNIPEVRNYQCSINGQSLIYGGDHKILITKPIVLKLSFIDTPPYRAIFNDYAIYGTNDIEGDTLEGFFETPIIFYTVPSFELHTKVNENKIALNFNYFGRMPIPYGYYLFKDTMPFGFTLEDYYIRHVEWFKDGKSISNSEIELTVTSPGKYYAQVTSNYDYPYTSDTITFTNEQLGIITDCIDELIDARKASISKGEYGYDNELKTQLKVYPNPFTDELRFNFSVCNQLKLIMELYNIAGIKIRQQVLELNRQELSSFKIELGDLPKGLYLLNLNANEYQLTTKIIKQ